MSVYDDMLSGYFAVRKDTAIPLIGFDEDLKRRGELGQLIAKMETEKKLIDQRIKLFLGENETAENDKGLLDLAFRNEHMRSIEAHTIGQQEYFKDSKVRDDSGNLPATDRKQKK